MNKLVDVAMPAADVCTTNTLFKDIFDDTSNILSSVKWLASRGLIDNQQTCP